MKLKKDTKKILKLIRKNKLLFTLSSLLDLSFIIAFITIFWQIVYKKIFQILLALSNHLNTLKNLPQDMSQQAAAYQSLASNIEFIALFYSLVRWVIIFALAVFILWIVFQSINFFIAAKILHKKTRFWSYIGKFSLFSFFFYLLIVLDFWLTIYLATLNTKIVLPVFPQAIINIIFLTILIIILYFGFISYSEIRKKKIISSFLNTFKTGFKKKTLIAYVLPLLKIAICLLLLYLLFDLNIILFYIVFLFFFIPSISIARIMFFYFIEK